MDPSELFAGTLVRVNQGSGANHWLSAPIGLVIHALAFAIVTITALYTPPAEKPPQVATLVLSFAPPPPPPIRLGSPLGAEGTPTSSSPSAEPRPAAMSSVLRSAVVPRIPAEILSARFELTLGVEDGFLDGQPDGMPGGVPGGVVGGVPGGLVGGRIGGKGTSVSEFPIPEVGPRPIRMPQPRYTRKAIRDNVSGTVVLRVVIDEQGKVRVLEVLRSIPELDDEAIRVVESEWRFHPATRQGRPVPALSDLRVRFNLY